MNYTIWGATGQARVVRPIADRAGHRLTRLIDRNTSIDSPFADILRVDTPEDYEYTRFDVAERQGFIVAIAGERGTDRYAISSRFIDDGYAALSVEHETSYRSYTAEVDIGLQLMPMACICENVRIGRFVIINTKASIDHDCVIGDGVHVMPGATLAGEVIVDNFATIGAGATVLPRLRIGANAIVGAGAVVTRDVPPNTTVVGIPARMHQRYVG